MERGDGLLVGLLLRIQPRKTVIGLRDQRLGPGLELAGPEALEFELEFQFCGLFLQRRLGVPDPLLDRLDDLVLVREVLEFLPGGSAGAIFQVVNERLESLLDDGGADFLVLVGLVAADLLGGLDGLGQLALGFGDGRLERLNGVGFGLEVSAMR